MTLGQSGPRTAELGVRRSPDCCLFQMVELSVCVVHFQGRGALQDIDQMSLFKPLCKFTATIRHIRDIVPTVKRALQEAQSGTPGACSQVYPEIQFLTLPCLIGQMFVGPSECIKIQTDAR